MRHLSILLLLLATPLHAADVWVLEGSVGGCQLTWTADTLFLNTGATPANVALLGVSDGPDAAITRIITLAPQQLTSMAGTPPGFSWAPASGAAPFIVHLDVPDSVVVQNILNVGMRNCAPLPTPDPISAYGVAQLPPFRALFPAGQTRYIAGSGLGLIDSRTNVGIYNASPFTAIADIRVFRGCDNTLTDRTEEAIPPNSLRQVSLRAHSANTCAENIVPRWADYVAVTVSQPSLSYVANVVNGETPRVLLSVQ